MNTDENLGRRAAIHAALGDPARLAIVDVLTDGEASPSELQRLLTMGSNLLAHHVRVLQEAGLLARTRSEADRRRTYLRLDTAVLAGLRPARTRRADRVVFVCTENSARSQLAAALWSTGAAPVPATSAGTRPAVAVHPGALAAARRSGVPAPVGSPRHVEDVLGAGDLVVTVCDRAHEELALSPCTALHWAVADPVRRGDPATFDRTVGDLAARISRLAPTVTATDSGARP